MEPTQALEKADLSPVTDYLGTLWKIWTRSEPQVLGLQNGISRDDLMIKI